MNRKEEQLDIGAPISRETLYELVWSEPMLKVAARFDLSSSYMARVCTALHVPRPAAGYWGKAAVGRAPATPELPPARPGDQLTWTKGESIRIPAPVARISIEASTRSQRKLLADAREDVQTRSERVTTHHMVSDVKKLFEKGRFSHELGYLKPDKKTLVDVIATPATLDRALSFANALFRAFEQRQHRVLFARDYEENQRRAPDILEQPAGPLSSYTNLWSPSYPTVVFVDTVGFGLTIIEMAEEVLARYVDGEYIRDSEYKPPKRRYGYDSTWTTKRQFPTKRLRLQAYSAFRGTQWKQHWDEKDQPLDSLVEKIVTTLEKSVSDVSRLIDECRRKQELQRREWEAQRERWRREEEQQRVADAHKQSHEELRQLMSAWAAAREREAFFASLESTLDNVAREDREHLLSRVKIGRTLLGTADVLERFRRWRTPDERLAAEPESRSDDSD